MRQLLTFLCQSDLLGGSIDFATGGTGIVVVTGGAQTRAGAHRVFERLAKGLSDEGYPTLRFDRRGVGDSEGDDPGFGGSAADLAAAAEALRSNCASVTRLVGLGLCDGGTALALFGDAAGLDGLVLVNPWLVEADAGVPPPAAIKRHYRRQLTSLTGWRKVLSGSVSWQKLFEGITQVAKASHSLLATDVAAALQQSGLPVALILARGDATAIAAEAEWTSPRFRAVREQAITLAHVESDSHTFARAGDEAALLARCLEAVRAIETSGRG